LTRIEIRIDRLLKRDEVPGFAVTRQVTLPPITQPVEGQAAEPEPPKKPTPMLGRGGRPPRRIRRAL
jgi:hypothetical protein